MEGEEEMTKETIEEKLHSGQKVSVKEFAEYLTEDLPKATKEEIHQRKQEIYDNRVKSYAELTNLIDNNDGRLMRLEDGSVHLF
jgi:hypothetical protein